LARGVDEVIVGDVLDHTGLVGTGVFDCHERLGAIGAAIGMDRQSLGLAEIHIGLAVQLGEIEGHILLGHLADADPDVGRDPVPFRIGRHHDDLMLLAHPFVQITGCGMA
jgi:hypothetical protein